LDPKKKNKKPNAEVVWTQLEDLLVPRLSVIDRAIYSHLLRHSRLEGKLCLRFSIRWLARHIRLSAGPVRGAVRRLVAQGALRLVQRSKTGHVVEVRPPEEIRPEKLNGVEHGPLIPTATWSRAASGQGKSSAQKRFSESRRGYPPMHHEDHDGRRFAGIFSSVCMVICL